MSTGPRNAEQTRARILDAARHLFAGQGIDVSPRDIAAAAGVMRRLEQIAPYGLCNGITQAGRT
jgi:hypothetical protein